MPLVLDQLNQIEDIRDPKKVIHPLQTVLFISICSICCGAESWEDVPLWAETHEEWLSSIVDMSNGIPSYSTVRRVFMAMDPACWGEMIHETVLAHHPNKSSENHVSIDGKTLRGSTCRAKEVRAMQMVSAWSVENNIILGEVKTDSKSNEVTAIPLLLALLDLEDTTITIDAMGCNEKIVQAILDKKAHYLLGLKKNQPTLYTAVEAYASEKGTQPENLVSDYFDDSHGRLVRRRYFAFDIPPEISVLGFSQMKSIIATETISSIKYEGSSVSAEWRYYVTDHNKDHPGLSNYIRDHWQVESMHWLLDVHLSDDKDKKYEKNAAENFARTKRFFLNLVKSKPPRGKKRSVRSNIKRVGWDLNYLVTLLFP